MEFLGLFFVFFGFLNINRSYILFPLLTKNMARSRRKSPLQSTFKDYLVPIIWWVLILILIYSFLWKDGSSWDTNTSQGWSAADIVFNDASTEAFIIYPGDVREKIVDTTDLYAWETLVVESWSASLTPEDGNSINLNKIAEFKINDDGSYNLYSSDAWIQLEQDTSISMRYANIDAPAGSVISLTQNEAWSTVYVLSWDVKVSNLADVSTLVTKWQKVSVSRLNAAKDDLEIAANKSSIDSYFKGSDWFIANQGNTTLNTDDVSLVNTSASGSVNNSWSLDTPVWDESLFLRFNRLQDEMTLTEGSIDISGNILSDTVNSVTVNNSQVAIDSEKNFTLSNFSLPNSVNDLVVKVYDSSKNVLDKQVYTIYSSADWALTNTPTTTNPLQTWGTTYKIDATKFWFNAPSTTGKFSTTSPEVTIRWYTTAPWITRVQVNGFTLSSFNGTNWRYHAFERFTTLKEWSNQYKIDYYGADGKIVYTDYYTIVKKSPPTVDTPTTQEDTSVSSNEASTESEEALFSN